MDASAEHVIESIDTSLHRFGALVAPRVNPLSVAACALAAIATPLFHWARGFHAYLGVTYIEGLVAVLAAFELLLVCILRVVGAIGRVTYLRLALPSAVASAAAPAWFWLTTVGTVDDCGECLRLFNPVILRAAPGLYASMLASVAAILLLLFDAFVSRKLPRPRQLNWPITRLASPDF